MNYPSALLLDEPLGALDLKLRQAMQLELKRIQREVGITFIFVTHDQEEALTMSDRIAVMSEGRVEQIGSPEEIYHEPETVFVAGFIGMANLLPAVIEATRRRARGRARRRRPRRARRRRSTASTSATPATLMVRPERMHLRLDEPRRRLGVRAGRGRRPRLPGPGRPLRPARARTAAPIVAHVGPDEDLPLLRPGDRVWACWEPEAGRLLRRAETASRPDPSRARDRRAEARRATRSER